MDMFFGSRYMAMSPAYKLLENEKNKKTCQHIERGFKNKPPTAKLTINKSIALSFVLLSEMVTTPISDIRLITTTLPIVQSQTFIKTPFIVPKFTLLSLSKV
jgi:hypothetical protein